MTEVYNMQTGDLYHVAQDMREAVVTARMVGDEQQDPHNKEARAHWHSQVQVIRPWPEAVMPLAALCGDYVTTIPSMRTLGSVKEA